MEQAIQQIIDSPWFFRALALVVLAFFYGIYFTKQIAQKKRGIQTRQIGRRKEKGLRTVELLMAAATLSVVVAELISVALDWNYMPSGARFTGFCLGMCGDVLFLISVLFMKDSWRAGIPEKDKTKLVTSGIYRYSRNPAFCGFDLQILQEEKYMLKTFGDEYAGYKKTVFRYLGRRSKKKQQGE